MMEFEHDSPREALFNELFEIADKFGFNLTNNTPEPANGMFHIADFCSDVESAVLKSGYVPNTEKP